MRDGKIESDERNDQPLGWARLAGAGGRIVGDAGGGGRVTLPFPGSAWERNCLVGSGLPFWCERLSVTASGGCEAEASLSVQSQAELGTRNDAEAARDLYSPC